MFKKIICVLAFVGLFDVYFSLVLSQRWEWAGYETLQRTSLVGELQFLPAMRLWRGPASSINQHAFLKSKCGGLERQRLLRTVQA